MKTDYCALDLEFGCSAIGEPHTHTHSQLTVNCACADIQKKYKKLALLYHPDKAGASSENIDRFQEVTTAYSVLNADDSRSAYWDMYKLRCYLHQGPLMEGQALAPFYLLHVRKQEKTAHAALARRHDAVARWTLAAQTLLPCAGHVARAAALRRLGRGIHPEWEEGRGPSTSADKGDQERKTDRT